MSLFYRLNVVPLKVPPLKERIDDIPIFIDYFLEVCSKDLGVKNNKILKEHYHLLQSLNFSGNLRQLKNIIEHLLIVTQNHTSEEVGKLIMSYDSTKDTQNFSDIIQKNAQFILLKMPENFLKRNTLIYKSRDLIIMYLKQLNLLVWKDLLCIENSNY